jgi:hypothetical protein
VSENLSPEDCLKYLSTSVGLPVSMYKHLSCAAVEIKLATGSSNADTCEKLHDRF